MKHLIIIVISSLILSCNKGRQEENDNQLEFLSVTELSVLDSDGKEAKLNIGYSIIFESTTLENCELKSKEEVNDKIVVISIRSVVRSEFSHISKNEIDLIDKDRLKKKINEQLDFGIVLNGEKLDRCTVSLGLFSITERK